MSESSPTAGRIAKLSDTITLFNRYWRESSYRRLHQEAGVKDFAFGNPHNLPLPEYVETLQHKVVPENKDWFAYKMSEPESRQAVAESLRLWRGVTYEPEDIHLTTGAWAAIANALYALVDPGDEVIMMTPPWFFYEMLIVQAGGSTVRVKVDAASFDLDLEAIERAITARTRVVIVNSPQNPTGKIYPAETLQKLADMMTAASARYGRTIYLLSDESYSRIIFDGRSYPSPTTFYPHSLLVYTYGKTLLTPGQRIGYLALPPIMPEAERQALDEAIYISQLALSFSFPNALLQHSLADLDRQSIDLEELQQKRDRLVSAMRAMGYELHSPEGTFYLLPRSPLADDGAFTELLAEYQILALPGVIVELPGYFRLSLTASAEMIEAALPGFEAAFQAARGR